MRERLICSKADSLLRPGVAREWYYCFRNKIGSGNKGMCAELKFHDPGLGHRLDSERRIGGDSG